jgi:hypothetical protein
MVQRHPARENPQQAAVRLDPALIEVLESAARLPQLVPDAVLLGDIEAGVRQLIRRVPLEVTELHLPSGVGVRVPTPDETLRITTFLIVRHNQVRDYLDVAALADRYGLDHAAGVLARIDELCADQHDGEGRGVAS